MLFTRTRIRAAAAAVMMLFACETYAASDAATPKTVKTVKVKASPTVQRKSAYSPEDLAAERQRRVRIIERSNTIFTLLGGEMALQKGDAGTALATYMVMLDRTKSPEVAERAMEMAISLNAFDQAEMIYQKWREIEPVAGEAQRRMGWVRDLMLGHTNQTVRGLDDVLQNATPEQTQRIFLVLSQAAVQQPGLAEKAAKEVHKAAANYPDMPEAAIADVIFSGQDHKDRHAVAALQRLAGLDTEILPPTWLTLRLMAQRNPEVLSRFFAKTDTAKLSPAWQELEIGTLIASKQPEKALDRLKVLLAENPNADLYIQAALLANSQKDSIAVVNTYLEKAYNIGTSEQQSRAAIIGAMRYADDKDYAKADAWADKINAAEYVFDKAVLKASIAAERGDAKTALAEARKAQKLPEQQGRFFGIAELQRVYLYALAQHNRPQEALAELNTLAAQAAKQPNAEEILPEILYQRAMVYSRLNQSDKAVADLRRFLAMNPNSASGMNSLGYTLLTAPDGQNHLDEAFRLIQTAYNMEPDSAAINDSMGWVYYKKGDAQSALPYLQYAYKHYPDAEVAAHLGEVLWQTGEQAEAKRIWAEGLQKDGDIKLLQETMQRFGVSVPAASKTGKSAR
ncbi:tetratricopeptide repeat protein [Neisseria perflava]|uniref:tetratricopeptide repeat protein n=1 Tax=Neisseria perflava TaxID=33053 RepID=UPI00209F48A9|nr:tetratricopeptide repeat protein [Neisseria perflava]MCP1660205.1 tetratricopeptide (TPR) repeat protein [Neisseria perflava]